MKRKIFKPLTVKLSPKHIQQLALILKYSSARSKEGHQLMTVCIEPQQNQLRFITSNPSQISELIVTLKDCPWPAPMQFAITADFVANIFTKDLSNQPLTWVFTPQADDSIEISFPTLSQYRHTHSQPAVKAHLKNQEWQSRVSPTMHGATLFGLLVEQLKPQTPFDIAKLNPGSDKITVVRSGVISEVQSPLAETLNCNAAVTTQVLASITKIIRSNTKQMGLAQVGDKLLIKTDNSSHVYQIDNIDVLKTAIKKTKTIVAFTIDGLAFKQELETYQKTAEVKKHQRSYLLVHDNRLMISATTENHKMADLPKVSDMQPDNVSELYSLRLNDISAVQLQGVIAKAAKAKKDKKDDNPIALRVESFSDGSHQLVFYNGKKAYAFVPLLPERDELSKMTALYCDYLKQIGVAQPPAEQGDLIGHSGLLDI